MEHYLQEEQPLDFDDFANQLLEQGAEQSPSHLHGGICGVLCGGGARDAEYCLAAVAQALHLEIHGELAGSCLRLAAITIQALQDEEFDFHPFLPDDEEDMEVRVIAMSDWCSAFLSGYAMSIATPESGALGEENSEILKDISAIASAAVDAVDDDVEPDEEESENHYFDLTEYLRFATLNLFMDLIDKEESAEQ
jgi:uncharacterized protein YgfB (UPF0149 family)